MVFDEKSKIELEAVKIIVVVTLKSCLSLFQKSYP